MPRVWTLSLVCAGLVGLTAACSGSSHAAAVPDSTSSVPVLSSSTPPVHVTHPSGAPVSFLTGLPGSPRTVVAIKVDNVSTGEQSGLNQADVVYCEEVEGGLTRLLAVFASTDPTSVGPVRSARESDIELLGQYGRIAIGFSGANAGVDAEVRAANLQDDEYDNYPADYHFDASREAPYKFLANVALIAAGHPGALSQDIGFRFGAVPVVSAAHPRTLVATASVSYPAAKVGLSWSGSQWLVSRNGSPQMLTDGTQASATNVLIQYVQVADSRFVDHNDNPTPFSTTVGTGQAVLLRGGRAYPGTWTRASAGADTSWASDAGGPLRLAPGRTWVLLVPVGVPLLSTP